MALVYRLLAPDEFERLRPIFVPRGIPQPDPTIERVGVVEDDGTIVAIAMLRLLPLMDGLWVEKQYRGGKIDYKRLAEVVDEPIRQLSGSRIYAISQMTLTERILADAGYEEVKAKVYEKRF